MLPKKIITTSGNGYFPSLTLNMPTSKEEARMRVYNQISPVWGFTDDTINAFFQTMLFNKNQFLNDGKPIIVDDPYVDGVWAEYLQIPHNLRRSKYKLNPSKYKPTKGADDANYYTIPIDEETKTQLIRDAELLPIGKNKLSTTLMGYNHGEHTVGKGLDPKRGPYVSYYDRWDLNPLSSRYSTESKWAKNPIIKKLGLIDNRKHGDLSFGLGNPIDFYDRIYLDDYYGVDSSARPGTYYGGYLPEIFVLSTGNGYSTNTVGNKVHFRIPVKPRKNDKK